MATQPEIRVRSGVVVSVQEAVRITRRLLAESIKGHHHIEGQTNNTHRLRALEGQCGGCQYVLPEKATLQKDGRRSREIIILRCAAGNSPLSLYTNTPLGAEAECPAFTPKDK